MHLKSWLATSCGLVFQSINRLHSLSCPLNQPTYIDAAVLVLHLHTHLSASAPHRSDSVHQACT
jgi:hypothetical protein